MTTTSVTCEIRLAEAIQYLAYTGGDAEVILHRRRLLGVIFRETVNERELETSETKKEKNLETRECASLLLLLLFVFVRSRFMDVEGSVLVLSVSGDKRL